MAGESRLRAASALVALSVALGVLGIASWYGCSVYDPSLLLPGADSGTMGDVVNPGDSHVGDDAHDAGTDAPPPPLSCPELFPPSKPASDDPSDAGDQTFIVAVHTIDIGLGDAGMAGILGYDLDQVYTCCDGGAESCKAAVTGATHCDDDEGRDNAGGHLFGALASLDSAQFNASSISQRIQQGAYSILLQVTHYNGQPDDTQVTAAMYASSGVTGDAGALWNGNDSWTLDDTFVTNPDASPVLPTHFDANAYVAGGTIVMHVNFPIAIGSTATNSFVIDLTAGIVTGQIVPDGTGGYALTNGNIAGRWNNAQLLAQLQTLSVGGTPICKTSMYYSLIKSEICQYSDIMTDPTSDKMGTTCDAISIGFGFSADPALLGPVVVATPPVSQCPQPEGGTPDAGLDDCTKP